MFICSTNSQTGKQILNTSDKYLTKPLCYCELEIFRTNWAFAHMDFQGQLMVYFRELDMVEP